MIFICNKCNFELGPCKVEVPVGAGIKLPPDSEGEHVLLCPFGCKDSAWKEADAR